MFCGELSHGKVPAMKNPIPAILERYLLEWMMIPGVLGAAEGVHRGKPSVLVLVEKKTRELEKLFPERLEGVRVVLKEVGRGGRSGRE
jgi:hypothetical protein